jgi:hypothetical protein
MNLPSHVKYPRSVASRLPVEFMLQRGLALLGAQRGVHPERQQRPRGLCYALLRGPVERRLAVGVVCANAVK